MICPPRVEISHITDGFLAFFAMRLIRRDSREGGLGLASSSKLLFVFVLFLSLFFLMLPLLLSGTACLIR